MKVKRCRACKSKDLHKFLDLGKRPPSDAFLKKEQLKFPEEKFPLEVLFCSNCSLVQLSYVVPPEKMYKADYVYVSSISPAMRVNWTQLAKEAAEKIGLKPSDLVIDIGGNDGTLLECFKPFNVRTLNIDPTQVALKSKEKGIDLINDFFNEKVAERVVKEKGKAKIITGTNVFAHINDWDDFLRGVNKLLDDNGLMVLEFPYLVDLIKNVEFDTIYHEHLSYLSIRPIIWLLNRFDMEVADVKRIPVHGGSLRLFAKKSSSNLPVNDAAKSLCNLEIKEGLDKLEKYQEFSRRVDELKGKLVKVLKELKSQGKKIAGDGAPAKGNTLLNYCEIGTDVLDFIAEVNPAKIGLFTPGMHIPVVEEERIYSERPDYLLLLAWNFKDDIMKKQQRYKDLGGKFIIPIPEPQIV